MFHILYMEYLFIPKNEYKILLLPVKFVCRLMRSMINHLVSCHLIQCLNYQSVPPLLAEKAHISKRPLPKPPSPSSADEYEVADLYDTIDENAQKRLRKLAEKSSQQPKGGPLNDAEEYYEEFDENAVPECPETSHLKGLKTVNILHQMCNFFFVLYRIKTICRTKWHSD